MRFRNHTERDGGSGKGKEADALKRLAAHRRALLDSLHKEQACIDCLDYLIYQIRKSKPNPSHKRGSHDENHYKYPF